VNLKKFLPYIVLLLLLIWHTVLIGQDRFPRPEFESGYVHPENQLQKPRAPFMGYVSSISDFSEFAGRYGTNYKLLKLLNPWLRKPYLTPKPGKIYTIKIPEAGTRSVEADGGKPMSVTSQGDKK
jgi:hypothetical protein